MSAYLSFRMAYRHFRADFGAMLLSLLSVTLGVGLVVAVQSMNVAVLRGFLETVDGVAGRASFSVGAGEGLAFSEDLVEKVAAVPGVKLAVPLVRGVAFPDDGSGELLTVHGVDLTQDAAVRLYHTANNARQVIPDALQFLNTPDSIVLGREFADRRQLHRGDAIDLVTPDGVKRFTIRGLLDPEGLARTLRGRLVVMDLYAAERAFTADGQINQIDVVVDAAADVETTKNAVASTLPEGLMVEEPALRKEVIRRTVGGFQSMLTAFSLLAVVAGFVICYSRLEAIVTARTWEAGLLRAVGLRRTAVFAELLKESLLLGLTGASLGVPLGLLIGRVGIPFLAATTALNFRLPVPSVEPAVRIEVLILGVAVGLMAALLATLVPALRLARTRPVVALTLRGRELAVPRPTVRSGLRPLLAILIIIALVVWQRASGLMALGLVTTGVMVLTVALCAAPLTRLGGVVLAAIWTRAFGPVGRFAGNHVRQHPARSTLTVATLGLGLGTVLLFGILAWSFERTLVSRLVASERADMVISSAFVSGGYRTAPLSERLLDELRAIPGVALVAGEQSKDVAYAGGVIVLKACDAACFRDRRLYEWPLESGALPDAMERVARGEAVLVTTSFARHYGNQPGEMIELRSPNGLLRLTVAGISSGAPESAVWMSRERYRTHWNDTALWTANVALGDGADYRAVETAIAQRLGAKYRLFIRSTEQLIDYFAGEVHQAFSLQYLLEAVTLILVVIAIGDTLASGVLERTREFGMMRAIGLHRSRLFGIVMLEGAAIGVLGLGLATVTGLALGAFWVKVQFPAVVGWDLDLHFPSTFVVSTLGLTILLCAAGSLLPALRAARLSAAQALRNE